MGEGRTRFALVGAEVAGREWLVGRLADVFGVVGGWKRTAGEASGRVLVDDEEKELVLTLHSIETVRSSSLILMDNDNADRSSHLLSTRIPSKTWI